MNVMNMTIPPEVKPALWGAAGGAVALAIIGFNWGGWTLGSTAASNARSAAEKAVTAALAPICADKFRQTAGAASSLVELKKIDAWEQGSFVEKGGWATLPGSTEPNSAVARACAELLGSPKL